MHDLVVKHSIRVYDAWCQWGSGWGLPRSSGRTTPTNVIPSSWHSVAFASCCALYVGGASWQEDLLTVCSPFQPRLTVSLSFSDLDANHPSLRYLLACCLESYVEVSISPSGSSGTPLSLWDRYPSQTNTYSMLPARVAPVQIACSPFLSLESRYHFQVDRFCT